MKKQEFLDLINKNKFAVLVFSCPLSIPLNFARHTWIVISEKGKTTRYDVAYPGKKKYCIKINTQKPWKGFQIFFLNRNPSLGLCFDGKLEYFISGNKNSKAEKALKIIKKEFGNYPFKNKYQFFGSNSNTFTQWLINKSKLKVKLPWNAFGKNYKQN